jgi:hypothetical protein
VFECHDGIGPEPGILHEQAHDRDCLATGYLLRGYCAAA